MREFNVPVWIVVYAETKEEAHAMGAAIADSIFSDDWEGDCEGAQGVLGARLEDIEDRGPVEVQPDGEITPQPLG